MSEIVDNLRKNGYWESPTPWAGIKPFMDYLRGSTAFPGHVVSRGNQTPMTLNMALSIPINTPSNIPNEYHFACHSMGETLAAPGLLDFLLPMTDVALEYFDREPALLYSVNAFWKKPLGHPGWHNDTDDRKIMALFMYGTDIFDYAAGPHAYVPGSHLWTTEEKQPYNDGVAVPDPSTTKTFYGPAGTWFITNTLGIHNGIPPDIGRNARLLLWARWGVSNPPKSYREDQLIAWPRSAINISEPSHEYQAASHLVIDWSK